MTDGLIHAWAPKIENTWMADTACTVVTVRWTEPPHE
jgi:hypothetical protein